MNVARDLDVAFIYTSLGGIVGPAERVSLARWIVHAEPDSETAENLRWSASTAPLSMELEAEDYGVVESILRAALAGSPSLVEHWLDATKDVAREWLDRVAQQLEAAA